MDQPNKMVAHPGSAPNTTSNWQLVVVGLPARLPGATQTTPGDAQAGLGHCDKQDGWPVATRLWLALAWLLGRAGRSHRSKHVLIFSAEQADRL